jgi:RNA polymerase sigma factor (TIGR02999 family)
MSIDDLINAHNAGDASATSELFKLIYAEVHQAARRLMAIEKPGHSLETTDLIGMAYARLQPSGTKVNDKGHFISLIAETMRHVLIDHARKKKAKRHGGGLVRVSLNTSWLSARESPLDVTALGESLTKLKSLYPRHVRVLDLRYFAGLSVEKTAVVLNVSPKTVKNDTQFAKAWLRRSLGL